MESLVRLTAKTEWRIKYDKDHTGCGSSCFVGGGL